jgi:hypothetical protein
MRRKCIGAKLDTESADAMVFGPLRGRGALPSAVKVRREACWSGGR